MTMELKIVAGNSSGSTGVICLMKIFKVPLESRQQKLLALIARHYHCDYVMPMRDAVAVDVDVAKTCVQKIVFSLNRDS